MPMIVCPFCKHQSQLKNSDGSYAFERREGVSYYGCPCGAIASPSLTEGWDVHLDARKVHGVLEQMVIQDPRYQPERRWTDVEDEGQSLGLLWVRPWATLVEGRTGKEGG